MLAAAYAADAVADRPAPTSTQEAVRRNRHSPALPVLLGAIIAAALIALVIVLLMSFNNPHSSARAPWDHPGAPIVHPKPLSVQ
jgi:hypothetical protein